MANYSFVGNSYHTLYMQMVAEKREQYNYQKEQYEKIPHRSLSMLLFYLDRELKNRKILHAILFNKLFFWNKPKFRVSASKYRRYSLYIGEFRSTEKSLHTLLYKLRGATQKDKLELVINSHGGNTLLYGK